MSFARQHATALRLVRKNGQAVTFTVTPRTLNPSTLATTDGTPATVSAVAMRVQGDPKQYEALGVIQREPITLLTVVEGFGDSVDDLRATVDWNGVTKTVKSVDPLAPDGDEILARVVAVS